MSAMDMDVDMDIDLGLDPEIAQLEAEAMKIVRRQSDRCSVARPTLNLSRKPAQRM
jgi:hypothetical protein